MKGGDISTTAHQVAVVGGGIAGAWIAYRLAQRDVPTVVISADDYMRALSRQWAPAMMRTRFLRCATAPAPDLFADVSTTQDLRYPAVVREHVGREFDELAALVEYVPLDEYMHPRQPVPGVRLGAGDEVVRAVLARFEELGGTIARGRVTELVMDGDVCLGLRYERDGVAGKMPCGAVVLASGGFSGLFRDGVGSNSGYLLGAYARHGGALANLELFNRFALGDPGRKRPVYPFELTGARLTRAGKLAAGLQDSLRACAGDDCDIEVFTRYWVPNLDVPHRVEWADREVALRPIRAFSMGGAATGRPGWAPDAPVNVFATGECGYGMVLDSVSGKPFPSFLAMGGALAGQLAGRAASCPGADFAVGAPAPGADQALRAETGRRLDAFQDTRFSAGAAREFAGWCRQERAGRRARPVTDSEDLDLLVLAEAYALSCLARTESRGFFFRPDFPSPDPGLDNLVTLARYGAGADEVAVTLVPREGGVAA